MSDTTQAVTTQEERGISIEERRELVLAAIWRIEQANESYRVVEANARSTSEDRRSARERSLSREREFSWQWQNVKAILEAAK